MKRLVLLGGGHAHVHVLRHLATARPDQVQVVLISPFARQLYSGMLPGYVAGHYAIDQLAIPLPPLAQAAGVEFAETAAVALDAREHTITLADGRVAEYDLLSIDTGSAPPRAAMPGAQEYALFVRPIERFVGLLDRLVDLARTRALDVPVIGGGAAGFELVLALAHRLRRDAAAHEHRLALVTGGAAPLAGYPDGVISRGRRVLSAHGISVVEQVCTAIESDRLHLADGATLASHAPVVAIGGAAPTWLQGSGLALDERGFIAVGATQQSTSHPEVFAAGDVATRVDAPHPKSGVYAVRAGPPLAANLLHALAGQAPQPYQPQRRTLNLLSCGDRHAMASWGAWAWQGDWVWRWKDHIDRSFITRYAGLRPAAAAQTAQAPP
jgi:pyridine nucleotide-disulfide oxidoreductase family protein